MGPGGSGVRAAMAAAMELFIPKVRLRSFQFPQWFSPELRHKFKCLRTMEGLCDTQFGGS